MIKKILLFSIIFRLILSPWVFHDDVTTNYWWGKFAVEFPLRGYYDWLDFGGYVKPDQPMIYILYYRTIRTIYQFFYGIFWQLNISLPIFPSNFMQWYFLYGNQIIEKIPIIIAEVYLIFLIYKLIKLNFNVKMATISAIFLSVYPPFIYNTSIWGSNDSLVNLLGLSSIYNYYKGNNIIGTILFTICFLFKSSLLIFIPIIFIIIIKNKITIKNLAINLTIIFLIIFFVSLPFATYNPIIWFFQIYFYKVIPGSMSQLTSNAMNFWALLYGLKPINDNIIFYNIFTARSISLVITVILSSICLVKLFKNYSFKHILLSLTSISLISFTFLTRMHERYTYPALIPLFLLCFYNRKFYIYFFVLTATHLLNVYNFWWIPKIPLLISLLNMTFVIKFISLINIIFTLKLMSSNVSKK